MNEDIASFSHYRRLRDAGDSIHKTASPESVEHEARTIETDETPDDILAEVQERPSDLADKILYIVDKAVSINDPELTASVLNFVRNGLDGNAPLEHNIKLCEEWIQLHQEALKDEELTDDTEPATTPADSIGSTVLAQVIPFPVHRRK